MMTALFDAHYEGIARLEIWTERDNHLSACAIYSDAVAFGASMAP